MKNLESILNEFAHYLQDINAPILSKFRTGITTIPEDKLIGLPTLPPDMNILYKWRNGFVHLEGDKLGKCWFFNLGIFIAFEEAIEVYRTLANELEKWDASKFPLFVSGGGDFHIIECDPLSANYSMIYLHSYSHPEFDILITKYDSLESFFRSVLKCYQEKVYRFDDEGNFDSDFKAECQICSLLNPRSDFWKIYL